MALGLTSDQEAIRDGVAELCRQFPGEYWRALDREDAYPGEFVAALTEGGWLAALIPEEYGGMGLGLSDAALILQEINHQGCNSGACHAQMYIMGTILRHGSEEQKRRFLPAIAAGELRLQAFGVTEPDAGSNTLALRTRADRRPDGGWLVNGQKIWTSRFAHSDLMLLLARTSTPAPGERRTGGLSTFLVDLREAGGAIDARPIRTLMNHATVELFIKDLALPADALVGEEGKGFAYILHSLNPERLLVAAEGVAIGQDALRRATRYARERVVFGRPIGQNQSIQHPLAERWMALEAAWTMVMKGAWLYDRHESCGAEANAAKFLGARAGFDACLQAVLTHGGFGYAKEYHVERLLREVTITRIAPITEQLILSFIAEKVLDLPKSY